MKVFISQPMRGKTREQIVSERAAVVAELKEQGHEEFDSFVTESTPPDGNVSLWYLGKSFQKLAEADAVYFMDGWQDARGCVMEHEAASRYGVQIIHD